jgi:hypothetical protein
MEEQLQRRQRPALGPPVANLVSDVQGALEVSLGPGLVALQEGDLETFAALYNGAGQAVLYAGRLQSAFESFERLSPL